MSQTCLRNTIIYPILFVDLLKQSSYKNAILLSLAHKQLTYFSKKYSKSNRVTLNKINKLSVVCDKDNIKVVKYVYKKVNLIGYNKFIYKCAGNDNIKIMRYFLNFGFNFIGVRLRIKRSYHVILSYCSKKGSMKIIRLLAGICPDNFVNYAFRICCKKGYIKAIKILLNRIVDIHIAGDYGLHLAAEKGHKEAVKLLLKFGADVNYKDCLALRLCVDECHVEVTKLLLNYGADVHTDNDYPLRISSEKGYIRRNDEMMELLLERGANVHADDDYALKMCVSYNCSKKVELLLNYGANIHTENNYALKNSVNFMRVLNLLLERGANIHELDYHTQQQIIRKIGFLKFIYYNTNNLLNRISNLINIP